MFKAVIKFEFSCHKEKSWEILIFNSNEWDLKLENNITSYLFILGMSSTDFMKIAQDYNKIWTKLHQIKKNKMFKF